MGNPVINDKVRLRWQKGMYDYHVILTGGRRQMHEEVMVGGNHMIMMDSI